LEGRRDHANWPNEKEPAKGGSGGMGGSRGGTPVDGPRVLGNRAKKKEKEARVKRQKRLNDIPEGRCEVRRGRSTKRGGRFSGEKRGSRESVINPASKQQKKRTPADVRERCARNNRLANSDREAPRK